MQGAYALPPLPPEGVPDVRYGTDTYLEPLGKTEHEIRLTSFRGPITVTARNLGTIGLKVSEGSDGSIVRASLTEGAPVTINRSLSQLRLEEVPASVEIPTAFSLEQNFPNPFNPVTKIRFGLPTATTVHLSLYNMLGERVLDLLNRELEAGYHQAAVDAAQLSSGTYFYKLEAGGFVRVRKMLLLR
jgi:hypothetical protein